MRQITGFALVSLFAMSACSSSSATKPGVTARPESVWVVGGTGNTATVEVTTSARAMTTRVNAPVARVWQLLPVVFDSLGISIGHLDHQQHVIGTGDFKARGKLGKAPLRRYVDCGTAKGGVPTADTYEVSMSIMTQVQPADQDASDVSTLVQAAARPLNFAGDYVRCFSTRAVEAEMMQLLARELAR